MITSDKILLVFYIPAGYKNISLYRLHISGVDSVILKVNLNLDASIYLPKEKLR